MTRVRPPYALKFPTKVTAIAKYKLGRCGGGGGGGGTIIKKKKKNKNKKNKKKKINLKKKKKKKKKKSLFNIVSCDNEYDT